MAAGGVTGLASFVGALVGVDTGADIRPEDVQGKSFGQLWEEYLLNEGQGADGGGNASEQKKQALKLAASAPSSSSRT